MNYVAFQRKQFGQPRKKITSTSLFSRTYYLYDTNLNFYIRLRRCIVHICNRTIPVTWRRELKREQNDSVKKLRSSAENVDCQCGEMSRSCSLYLRRWAKYRKYLKIKNKSTLNFKAGILTFLWYMQNYHYFQLSRKLKHVAETAILPGWFVGFVTKPLKCSLTHK